MASATESVFNDAFGRALRTKNTRWRSSIRVEQTQVLQENPSHQPDILLSPEDRSPVILELEYLPARTVEKDAESRLGKRLAENNKKIEHVFAIEIPKEFRTYDQSAIDTVILRCQFTFCVYSITEDCEIERWPDEGWITGDVDDLCQCLEVVSLSESLILRSTDVLEKGVSQAANLIKSSKKTVHENIAKFLHQSQGDQTDRMAIAIIANALMFHSRLEGEQNIQPLSSLSVSTGLHKKSVIDCWRWIVNNVNYWPIFKIAADLLDVLPNKQANQVLNRLHDTASELAEIGATSLNDLSGRMFQRLISDRKFLATFYTRPESAVLLAELIALRTKIDWQDADEVKKLRIADFACGTGTLIGAMYHTILSQHRRRGCDDAMIHSSMVNNSLLAFDIMPAATHLTASTVSNAHPNVVFDGTKIVTMPYGFNDQNIPQIGSLDLMIEQDTESLFSLGRGILRGLRDKDPNETITVHRNSLDVIIMNPHLLDPQHMTLQN